MFDTLSDRLEGVFKKLKGQGRITERNIEEALREVRLALLEADVNIKVVRDFVEHVKNKALGQEVLRSLTPEQHLIKFVATSCANVMGGRRANSTSRSSRRSRSWWSGCRARAKPLRWRSSRCGSKTDRKRHPLLVSTDVRRPAAMEQLRVLGAQIGVPVVDSNENRGSDRDRQRAPWPAPRPAATTRSLIDTAGRLQIDDELMDELERLKAAV